MEHITALSKTKILLMSKEDTTFFATVAFNLKTVWDTLIPTARTNGKEIRFNPAFFMSLTPEERLFLYLHETLHVCLMHVARLNGKDVRKYNIAADHVINLFLISRGFKMPKGGLADPKYEGMTTEQVYALLTDEECANLPGGIDILPLSSEGSEDKPDQATTELEDLLIQANIQAQQNQDSALAIPGEIQIFLNGLLQPKLPWNVILRRFVTSFKKDDYTFTRPNKNYFPEFYLPSLHSQGMGKVVIAVDTSASVSDDDFKRFVSEISVIVRKLKPDSLQLIQFDTALKSVHRIKNNRDLMGTQFSGRGGTHIAPLLEWVTENKPFLVLVFTDGYFKFPQEYKSRSNFIWLIHNHPNYTAPFGKTIKYEV